MIHKFFKAPKFWHDNESNLVKILEPLSRVYSVISNTYANSIISEKISVPVICAGGIVLGGSGKTPTAGLVCNILKEHGYNPHILTSGYGGYLKNVIKVDPMLHSYLQVGDEALIHADVASTWIGKNKFNTGKAAISAGADVLIMDDGLQNNVIQKDCKILVIDSLQGFGNCHTFPAGPLRESINSGVEKADIALIIGQKKLTLENQITAIKKDIPICYATVVVDPVVIENNRVIGFCGLGYPQKFKATLIDIGYELVDFIDFSDHHRYTITELQKLIGAAKSVDASLVTTMKDYIKIPVVFKTNISVITMHLEPTDTNFKDLLLATMQHHSI
jgi:tetraacyldisaccharide 4'-kinase